MNFREAYNNLIAQGYTPEAAMQVIASYSNFAKQGGTFLPNTLENNTNIPIQESPVEDFVATPIDTPTKAPVQGAVEDAAKGGTPGFFAKVKGGLNKNGGGTMKKGFTFPTLNQPFGNANLGYSLGGSYYANDAKRFLTPDEINLFKSGQAIEGIDPNNVMKTDAGVNVGGYQLGKLWTAGQGAINAIQTIKNADNLNKASQQGSDLKADLLATAASTPNVSSYLTADEQKMLNQLKRGNYYEDNWGSDLSDYGGVLGGGVKGALAGLPGGIPGMILGGLGGAINGGLKGATKKKETQNAKLDALYNTLNYARNDYNSMKRPNFSGLGLQQRYRNAYM